MNEYTTQIAHGLFIEGCDVDDQGPSDREETEV